MAYTELPWIVAGRRIRPYALAVSLASAVVGFSLLVQHDGPGNILDNSPHGLGLGISAIISSTLLWLGFWAKSSRWMQWGLLLTTGVFIARGVYIGLDTSFISQASLLSLCWGVASAGAYLLEVTTGHVLVEPKLLRERDEL